MKELGTTEDVLMSKHSARADNGTTPQEYDPLSYMDTYSNSKGSFF